MTSPHPPASTWRKVGVRDGDRVALLHAPASWTAADGPRVQLVRRRTARPCDVVVAFYRSAAALAAEAPSLPGSIAPAGAVWVAWPRRAGGHESDLTDGVVRGALLPLGLVDVKVAALDDDWSGLRFVRRRQPRAPR